MLDQVQIPAAADKFGLETPFLGIFNELITEYSDELIKTYVYLTYRNFFGS